MMKKLFLAALAAAGVLAPVSQVAAYRDYSEFEAEYNESRSIMGVSMLTATPPDLVFYIPAQVGGAAFSAVGNVIAWPFTIGYGVAQGDFGMDTFVPPSDWAEKYFGTVGAYAIGGPFWCLKKAFWDGPVWLFTSTPDPDIDMNMELDPAPGAAAPPAEAEIQPEENISSCP